MTIPELRQFALSLPAVEEKSHFEKPDFRVKKKIFAVLHLDKNAVVIKLTPLDQSVFCAFDASIIYPVPGGWGRQGWTFINLDKIPTPMLEDALTTAWQTVAPAKIVAAHFPNAGEQPDI